MNDLTWRILLVALGAAVVVEAIVLLGALRHIGSILSRMGPESYGDVVEGPEVGLELEEDFEGVPAALVFLSPTCSYCKPIAERLPAVRRQYPGIQVIPLIVGAGGSKGDAYIKSLGPTTRRDQTNLYGRLKIPGTPYAIAVDAGRAIVARGIVNSVAQLELLLDELFLSGSDGAISTIALTARTSAPE